LSHPQQDIRLRNSLGSLPTIILNQTAGHDQKAAVFLFMGGKPTDRRQRFPAGGLDEGAGIDDNDLGVVQRRDAIKPFLPEKAQHQLRVDQVLGTTKAYGRGFEHLIRGLGWRLKAE